MTPQAQLITGKNGDCHRACVASILEMPVVDVPNFAADRGQEWGHHFREWLRGFGYDMVNLTWEPVVAQWLAGAGCYGIMSGRTAAGTLHSVVCKGADIVHDPNPDADGKLAPFRDKPVDVQVFVILDPRW